MDQFSPSLVLIAKIALWIAVGFGLSLVLSFLAPAIVATLGQMRASLQRVREYVRESLIRNLSSRVDRFWSQQASEPRAPVAVELSRVADAIETVGVDQIARLEDVERGFVQGAETLRLVSVRPGDQSGPNIEALQQGSNRMKESFWFTAILLVMVIAFGGTNAFLLQLFFRDTLGQHRLLTYPLPDFEVSHALAILMAFMEVAAGIALHFRSSEDSESATSRIFRMAPWFAILALLMIETVAYALLSVNMHLAASLQVAESSPFYPIVQYALAFFGAGITIILSALGYRLWSTWQEYLAGRRETTILRELRSYSKSVRSTGGVLAAVNARLEEVRRSAETLQLQVVQGFTRAIGGKPERATVTEVIRDHALRFDATASPNSAGSAIRTKGQMVADLSVNLLLLALWVVLLYLNSAIVSGYLGTLGFGPTALTVGEGWVVALAISLFGFLVRDAHLASRHASITASSIPDRRGRRVLMYLAGIGFALGAVIDAAVAVLNHRLGSNGIVNVGYGLFLALALAIVSFNIDAMLLAAVNVLVLLMYTFGLVGLSLYLGLSLVGEAVLFLLGQVVRLLSVPGDWLRNRRLQAVG
jgi:hypothetical protein